MPSTSPLPLDGYGIEIECYLPEGATAVQAAAAVSHRIGAPVNFEGYNHQTRSHWKVVTDGSLGDTRGVEFVSPVLRGEAGLAQAAQVCRALTDFGCTVSKKCGLHVHVGVGTPDVGFFKRLVRLYAMFEPVIDRLMPPSRRASANAYCKAMTSTNLTTLASATSLAQVLQAVTGASSAQIHHANRFYKLNLVAYSRHQTVEFRQHSGTLDGDKIAMWTRLCLRMVNAARNSNLALGAVQPTASLNQARPGSKAHTIGEMMLRPEGATAREVCAATGWPSVSMPAQAAVCGLTYTTQRMGREVRYFANTTAAVTQVATPITLSGFADLIGADDAERHYMIVREQSLTGSHAWAA